jgi:hypothetical protein
VLNFDQYKGLLRTDIYRDDYRVDRSTKIYNTYFNGCGIKYKAPFYRSSDINEPIDQLYYISVYGFKMKEGSTFKRYDGPPLEYEKSTDVENCIMIQSDVAVDKLVYYLNIQESLVKMKEVDTLYMIQYLVQLATTKQQVPSSL